MWKQALKREEKKRAKEGFNISSLARFGNSPRKNAQTLTRRYSGSLTLHTFFMPPSASNKFSKHTEEQQREKRMKRRQWQFNAANNLSILILKAMNHITLLYQYFPLSLSAYPQVSLWQASTHAPQEVPFFSQISLIFIVEINKFEILSHIPPFDSRETFSCRWRSRWCASS